MSRILTQGVLAAVLWLVAQAACAAVAAAEAAKLGHKLTAVGAERAAGKAPPPPKAASAPVDEFAEAEDPPTQIPEWSATAPAVASNEKPLFTISAVNVGRYRENLTESHFALLQTFSNTYSMKVYPSRRTVRWPKEIETATAENATRCTLKGNDDLNDCRLGFPFPLPQNGAEVIWNHKLRWRGDTLSRSNDQLIVQTDGKFQRTRLAEEFDFRYANLKSGLVLSGQQREVLRYLSQALEPARLAGNFLLVHEKSGAGVGGRAAWALVPGSKRARREPKACCDNPYEGSDGMQFYDQVDMFSGPLDRYNWKLLGKREIFIPYNSLRLAASSSRHADLVRPAHLNQDLLRYELHRVWVVEATLRPGLAHTLRKRRFYVDEDSWTIVAVDMLDNYDQPYQFQEGHLQVSPATQRAEYVAEVIYHLNTERYFVTGLRADKPATSPAFAPGYFEPEALNKRTGGAGK